MISLFDKTGHMSLPWAEAGYQCLIVDIQHPEGIHPHPEFRNVWTQGANFRSATPMGFAMAVFAANKRQEVEA